MNNVVMRYVAVAILVIMIFVGFTSRVENVSKDKVILADGIEYEVDIILNAIIQNQLTLQELIADAHDEN